MRRKVSCPDALPLLLPDPDHSATKRFGWVDDDRLRCEADYDAGWRFRNYRIGGLEDIYDLADALRRAETADVDRGVFAIRGSLRDDADPRRPVNRQYKENNDAPDWRPHPEGRRWLMLDVDGAALPPEVSPPLLPPELEAVVESVTRRLPVCFQHTTTYYQWSSSAGLVKTDDELYRPGWDNVRLHLWYWANRPACSESLRALLKDWADQTGFPIDWRLFNPVQPHFLAPPIFRGGPDPLAGHRSGLLEQSTDVVNLPDHICDRPTFEELQRKRERKRQERRSKRKQAPRVRSHAQMKSAEERYARAALESACETVASAPVGTRETTLRDEAFGVGTLVGAGALPEAEARQRLIQAGKAAGLPNDEAEDKAERALTAGTEEPRDLTEVRRRNTDNQSSEPAPADTDGPDVEDIRAHFSGGRDYETPALTAHTPDRPLLDDLMRELPIDDFIALVERIPPAALPDDSRLPAA